jgi:hypothetical protein
MTNDKNIKRRILCCWLFSLILAVAGREAPEFVNLTDDVSNDGMVVSPVRQAVAQVSSRRVNPHEGVRYTNKGLCSCLRRQSFYLIPLLPSRAGQNLLHLLSLQRK